MPCAAEEGSGEDEDGEEWETSSETSESDTSEDEDGEGGEGAKEGEPKSDSGAPRLEGQTSTGSSSTQPIMDDVSDLSDGESERCPVCLSRFVGQRIGMPETCDHAFCLDCIMEWSKVSSVNPR